jgi:hypothetical protein
MSHNLLATTHLSLISRVGRMLAAISGMGGRQNREIEREIESQRESSSCCMLLLETGQRK